VLFISVPTVKSHVTAILGKLGLRSRTAAAGYAHAQGLIPHLPVSGTSLNP
jgi:DNA-binding NarL/FixJ family response regulator